MCFCVHVRMWIKLHMLWWEKSSKCGLDLLLQNNGNCSLQAVRSPSFLMMVYCDMFPVLIQRFLWSRYKGHSLSWYFLIRDTVHCVAGRRREGETTEGSVQGGSLFARLINSLCLSSHCLQPIMTLTLRSFMESNLKWFLFFFSAPQSSLFISFGF